MTLVGIEAINVFAGHAYVDVDKLARHRGLDTTRFANLLMKQKTVALPYEDPISFGINAARPLIEAMRPEELMKSWFAFGGQATEQFRKLMMGAAGGQT